MESEMPSTFTIALEALAKANKTLILDEAHLLFEHTNLVEEMFKYPQQWIGIPKPKFLLFSAAGTGQDKDGNSGVTPSEIRNKYMWYPPIPNGKELTNELKDAEVYLSVESVIFFMKLSCGHRGIFMSAMEWVQECQKDSTEEWNIHESVARVRASFEESRKEQLGGWNKGLRRYLTQSRAVRVNGKFSTLGNIPKEFAEVLLGGSKTKSGLNNQERSLTINGFLVPEQEKNDGEFVQCDWNDVVKLYVTSNSLMAEYYGDLFPKELGYQRQLIETDPKSGADMVARALPFMSFATVVDNLIPANGRELKTSMSADHLPYEDHYNSAMAQVLKDMKYTVSTPLNSITGKVDILITLGGDNICAIETILATRGQKSHNEHASRFQESENYKNASLKVLLIIGASKMILDKRLADTSGVAGLEIIGLVVSQAHDNYTMYVKPTSSKSQQEIQGPFFFVVDRVAKALQKGAHDQFIVVSAQRLAASRKRGNEVQERTSFILNIPGATIEQVRAKVKKIVEVSGKEVAVTDVRKQLEFWFDVDLSNSKDAVRALVLETMNE